MNPTRQTEKRAARLMAIHIRLTEHSATVEQLATEFGVEPRTIYKDLIDLQIPPINAPLQVCDGYWCIMPPE